MSIRLNSTFLAGHLTRDPQVRFLANEKAVANFGLACNRNFRLANGETKEDVLFIDVEAWGRTAEIVGQYLTKGSACIVQGRLALDSWEDNEGNRRSKIKIVADSVQFTSQNRSEGGGGRSESQSYSPPPSVPPVAAGGYDDDEPPFAQFCTGSVV